MKIKELEKTVNLAWSPKSQYPVLLAAGTTAQLDASFNTSAALELYKLNLEDPSFDLELCTSVPTENRFHKLVWTSWGHGDEPDKSLIAGGCDAGRIVFYNTAKLLKNENGHVTCTEKHTGPVRALEFNPFQRNLLASGAAQSQLFIWDVNNLSAPMSPQDDGTYTQPTDDIMSLAWHKQGPEVQHILATTFSTRCVVWDLKKNKAIMKLTDSVNKVRWKDMTWSPRISTQLCLASEEDSYPVIQLWDLRMATGAIKTFSGHRKGVLSVAWCYEDPNLIVSCGKDNKLIFWDANGEGENGDILCDVPLSSQWNFEVKWCPSNPSFISTSSLDSHASVYTLSGGPHVTETTHRIADSFPGVHHFSQTAPPQQIHPEQSFIQLPKAPKWIKKPVGVSFGFGGKLVSFDATEPTIVNVSQVVTEHELMFKFKELLDALEQNRYEEHCEKKAELATNLYAKEVWNFIKCQFNHYENETFSNKVCTILGISETLLSQKLKALNIVDEENSIKNNDTFGNDSIYNMSRIGPADDTDLFDNLANQQQKLYQSSTMNGTNVNNLQPLKKPFKIIDSNDLDNAICDALLLGDRELAVDLLIRNDKMADALALAATGGPELMARAQIKYFEKNDHYLTTLVSAIVNEDWCSIVETCDLAHWNQILVAILNHTKEDEFRALCELLAQRLLDEGDDTLKKNALICFVCAGNINRLLDSWKIVDQTSTMDIQELVEIGLIMKEAIKLRGSDVPVCGMFAKVLVQYAELLASQGYLTAAYTYLGETSEDESIHMLKERLACALGFTTAYSNRKETQQPSRSINQLQPQIPPQQSAFTAYGAYPTPMAATPYGNLTKPIPKQPPVNQVSPMSMTANQVPPFNAVKPTSSAPPPPSASANASYGAYPPPTAPMISSQMQQVASPTMPPQMANSQVFGQQPTMAPPFNMQQSSTLPPPPPPVGSIMARSTPTPPAPPPASQVPYNNLRQTPDHIAGQGRKYKVDPSVQGGTGHRGSFSGGVYQNVASTSTPFNAIPPFSAQNDLSAYQMSNHVASFPVSQSNAPPFMTNQCVSTPMMQPSMPTPMMAPKASQAIPPSAPSIPSSTPSMIPSAQSKPPSTPPMSSRGPPIATSAPLKPSFPDPMAHTGVSMLNSVPLSGPPMPKTTMLSGPPMPNPTMLSGPPASNPTTLVGPPMPSFKFQNPTMPPTDHSALPSANPPNMMMQSNFTTPVPSSVSSFPQPNSMNHGGFQSAPTAVPPTQILQPNSLQKASQAAPSQFPSFTSGWNDPPSLSFEKPISNQFPTKASNISRDEDREIASITSRPPIPEEHMHIQTVLEELKNQCVNKTNNPQMKRKLLDLASKLELLYNGIATHKLSPQTLTLLHEIVKAIQQGNYQACLSYHTQLVSGTDFATIANFISSIKILVQCALQLEVYI